MIFFVVLLDHEIEYEIIENNFTCHSKTNFITLITNLYPSFLIAFFSVNKSEPFSFKSSAILSF